MVIWIISKKESLVASHNMQQILAESTHNFCSYFENRPKKGQTTSNENIASLAEVIKYN